jgi:predicted enzyme related to lactoylglutathione lyase
MYRLTGEGRTSEEPGSSEGRHVRVAEVTAAGCHAGPEEGGLVLKLNSVMIGSEDPKALGDFYKKIFGAPTWEDEGYIGWELGGPGLMIGAHSEVKGRNEMPGRIMWNLETPDVKGEFDRIKGLGVTVVQEPYRPGGGENESFWMATFEDPDGNYFQLASPMPEM